MAQPVAHNGEIARPVRFTHCFDHFDRNDKIKGALDVTVITQLDLDLLLKPAPPRSLLAVSKLLGRQGDPVNKRASFTRRQLGEPAPTAAYFKNAVTRLNVETIKNTTIFCALRAFQIAGFPRVEQGRRI